MKWLATAAAFILVANYPSLSTANPRAGGIESWEDGNDLWEICGSSTEGPPAEACGAFVAGAASGIGLGAGTDRSGHERSPFCTGPGSIKGGQLADVVRKYLWEHPELRNRGATWLVRNALSRAFPCDAPPQP